MSGEGSRGRHGGYLLADTLLGEGQTCPQEATSKVENECLSWKIDMAAGVPSLRHWFPNPENGHQIFFYVRVGHFSEKKVYSRKGKLVAQLSFVGSALCFNYVNSGPTFKN